MSIWFLVVIAAVILISIAVSYNRFISEKTLIQNAWSDIETELKRRYDLIPNLVETVKGYAAHESSVLEELARTRAAAVAATGSPGQQAQAEGPFVAAIRQVFAVAENYPQLRASDNFLALQQELAITEDRIQAARRFYNANVQAYNRRVGSVPSNLVAAVCGFTPAEFFELDPATQAQVSQPVKVDFTNPQQPAA
jgi:LemA protein